jgi:hypothetical protein
VRAPATVGRERERQKNLDEGDAPGTLSGSHLGRAALKEGAVVADGE